MSEVSEEIVNMIVSNTYTVQDLERRLGVLRGCVEAALFTETDMPYLEECAVYLDTHASAVDAHAVREWGESVLNAFSQSNVRTLIKKIQTMAEELPILTIYVPCEFSDPEIKPISEWCRKEESQHMMLDVHVDAAVVGGCAFIAGDTYQEISFTTRLQESPQLITNLLSGYARE